MPLIITPTTTFNQLSGQIALSQIPDDIFRANALGRAPFEDGVMTFIKLGSDAKALILAGL